MALLRRDIGKFLSTSPLRGTTRAAGPGPAALFISIHVPLAGDDGWIRYSDSRRFCISIHVPLAGDDQGRPARRPAFWDFYPRPPCGGRHSGEERSKTASRFLSTSPLRGTTTCAFRGRKFPTLFLSTSPLRGTTMIFCRSSRVTFIFLSTSPLRGTTNATKPQLTHLLISIHVPLAGDDRVAGGQQADVIHISIHVPLAGDDIFTRTKSCCSRISIHVPLAGDDFFVKNNTVFTEIFLSTSPLRGTT